MSSDVIDVRCYHRLADAQAYRAPVNALNHASARPDPFSTWEFYDHSLRHAEAWPQGDGLRLWLLLAFRGDELVGCLALKACTQFVLGLRSVRLALLTAHVGDRPHVVARAADAAAVTAAIYAYLLHRRRDWSLLEFEQQGADSALLPVPDRAARGVWRARLWPNMATGIIELRWASLGAYFAALSKKARSNLSRQVRALLGAGDVQLLTSSDPQATRWLFELYCQIEPHSWKGQADVAISRSAGSTAFCAGLLDADQPMTMVVQVLLLDGAPIAGLISGAYGKGLYALHVVYDERKAELAPGSAMLLMGMRLAIGRGCEFVNLLWGSGHYKTRWLAQMHATHSLQIYRVGTPYHWRSLLGDLRRRWLGVAATAPAVHFNPLRRALGLGPGSRSGAVVTGAAPARTCDAAALVARVRARPGEYLDAGQLAAVMPFATGLARAAAVA